MKSQLQRMALICSLAVAVVVLSSCGGLNGTYIEAPRGPRGLCSLVINNNFADPVVVKLYEVRDPTNCLHYVYVGQKNTAIIEGIAPGTLMLRYSKGREWDMAAKQFKLDRANFETDQVFKFEESETETKTSDGIRTEKRWSVQQFTLNTSGGEGNVTTSQIDDKEFQDK